MYGTPAPRAPGQRGMCWIQDRGSASGTFLVLAHDDNSRDQHVLIPGDRFAIGAAEFLVTSMTVKQTAKLSSPPTGESVSPDAVEAAAQIAFELLALEPQMVHDQLESAFHGCRNVSRGWEARLVHGDRSGRFCFCFFG